ncbi:glycosyltransferase family 4 protein [Sphingomonas sp. TZW2008]|uniref:glycosyltransferase family 4 protein n=1 Tax=Sphingomonas sp. TZW2008 TaxID=1917973 RepID=UPI0015C51A5A|nr:glycosyltransferase family 4 protein [Sphingomonas sp. TZW2008]
MSDLPPTLFVGLSAEGPGGIQRFNRRVLAALTAIGAPARCVMLNDAPVNGDRLRLMRAIGRAARSAPVLLLGHVNLLPVAAGYRLMNPAGRVMLFAHGIEVWGDPAYRRVRRWEPAAMRALVDRVAVVSDFSRDRMTAAFGIAPDRFHLFPNAVDLPPPAGASGGGPPTVLAVARLGAGEREKRVDDLIRALPIVAASVPEARLMIIGEGPLRAELAGLAATLGVGKRVDLLGGVDEMALTQAYAGARAFALPSTKEGFGIVYLEAWARGVPVVAAKGGAPAAMIADGVDGYTVPPGDVPALAAALIALLTNPEAAAGMGAAGRAKVQQCYSAPAFNANLRRLLQR